VKLLQLLIQRDFAKAACRSRNVCAALVILCLTVTPATGLSRTAARGIVPSFASSLGHLRHAAVASDSQAASAAGVEVLKAGGNAADAACATVLALGVVDPFASGLGGGGFALVYHARSGQRVALDFRESAPRRLLPGRRGQPLVIAKQSGLSVGVPGEPRGLAELVRRFGALPFSRCIEPALRLARGFAVSPWLARQIGDELERNPTNGPALVGALFGIDGAAAARLKTGDRVARPALTRTLDKLRREGADGFYKGRIAKAMVDATAAAGGVLGLDDLAAYATVERTPLLSQFLGHGVLTMPPPSAGGVIVAQALGILQEQAAAMKRAGAASAETLHRQVEALKHGFADRARFLGDPAFARLPMEHLLDPAYHHQLSGRLAPDGVLAHQAYGTPALRTPQPPPDAGTAHVSVIDQAGNAVALTTTINLGFGARIIAGDTGILLNDEMDDFTASPESHDVFALAGGTANFAEPGKRPLSSMSPTIVLGPDGVELVTGAAGGPRIVSTTLQIVLDVLLFGQSAEQAVRAPRVHHQWEPDSLFYEPGLSAETVNALETKGHHVQAAPDLAKANAIVRTRAGLDAASDPRSGGAPAGY
jgi:gamma-glutamyltranspeptidase / glutathione hydrolase